MKTVGAIYDQDFARSGRDSAEAEMARPEVVTLDQWEQRGSRERIKEWYDDLYADLFQVPNARYH